MWDGVLNWLSSPPLMLAFKGGFSKCLGAYHLYESGVLMSHKGLPTEGLIGKAK